MSGGIITRLHPNPKTDGVIAVATQDCEPVLEQNKELRSDQQKSDWGRHIASVPTVILYRWLVDEWEKGNHGLKLQSPEFLALVRRKLQDSEWAYLRTDK